MTPEMKISRAVTKLAFSHAFYGSLLMSCGHLPRKDMPTMATDGKKVFWSPDFVDKLSEEHTRSILAHEILHIVFGHCAVHEGFPNQPLQNIAMDHVINITLGDDGFSFPDNVIKDEVFRGMTWQQVYRILDDCMDKNKEKEEGKTPNYDEGAAGDAGLSQEKQEQLGKDTQNQVEDPDIMDVIENSNLSEEEKEELKRKIIQAAEAQKNSGIGKLPGGVEELIDEIRTSKVDWKEYLAETLQTRFPIDYTMRRPNKKFLESYDIYMPTMDGTQVGIIGAHLDMSGSVDWDEKVDFLAELNEISQTYQPERVYIFYTDCEVAHVEIYEQGEEITELNAKGGGGTSFVPTFDYIRDEGIEVDQMIVFSDMEVGPYCFPEEEPDFPTLFISTRSHYDVPFGECITTSGK